MDVVDQEKKTAALNAPSTASNSHEAMDEFFNQLQSEMRRPDVSQEAVAAAFQAIQQMALDSDVEKPMAPVVTAEGHCPGCGTASVAGSRFCAACGLPLQNTSEGVQASGSSAGQHHYHHHYHHHYFPTPAGATVARPATPPVNIRDAARTRPQLAPTGLSRAETALRRMTTDWMQACNTKHIDDLIELYVPDAMVLRPNVPAMRGTAAIREFFVGALNAGLGEVEMEPLRVEVMGEMAYEAGRCKMLVPVTMGKRREERGKYMILMSRQGPNEWKIVSDVWSSDLGLATTDTAAAKSPRKNP
jgi:ketosteroid isomerase-like protein